MSFSHSSTISLVDRNFKLQNESRNTIKVVHIAFPVYSHTSFMWGGFRVIEFCESMTRFLSKSEFESENWNVNESDMNHSDSFMNWNSQFIKKIWLIWESFKTQILLLLWVLNKKVSRAKEEIKSMTRGSLFLGEPFL